MPISKPTKETFDAARAHLERHFQDFVFSVFPGHVAALRDVLDFVAPDPGPPRPADMAELARLVAKELRSRGIWADVVGDDSLIRIPMPSHARNALHDHIRGRLISLMLSEFDNLTPRGCADVIQAEEVKRAQEWASDT